MLLVNKYVPGIGSFSLLEAAWPSSNIFVMSRPRSFAMSSLFIISASSEIKNVNKLLANLRDIVSFSDKLLNFCGHLKKTMSLVTRLEYIHTS